MRKNTLISRISVTLVVLLLIMAASAAFAVRVQAAGLEYSESANGNTLMIQDDAGLFADSDRDRLAESMRPVTKYANVLLLTTSDNPTSPENYAWQQGSAAFGQSASFTVFLIDMDNRKVYIGSTADIRKTLTTARANTITDNVYTYASQSDYTGCAATAFEQMFTVLEGGNIPAPMKIIGCILIALIAGLTVCYIIMSSAGKIKAASVQEIETGMGKNEVLVSNISKVKTGSHFVRSSSGHGGSGGGGGFSGGGGGGGGFGGGGHSF